MNTKEPMIGDWVNLSDVDEEIIPCRVVELHTDELLIIQPKDKACDIVGYDMVRPIPLTAEILEKNGWWYDIEDMWQHDEVNFCIEKWNGRFQCYDINQIKLYSVHQLQHALRLCGLNKLADGLKV